MLSRVCVPAGVPPGVLPAPGVLLAPGVPLPWRVVFPPLDESAFTSRKPLPPVRARSDSQARPWRRCVSWVAAPRAVPHLARPPEGAPVRTSVQAASSVPAGETPEDTHCQNSPTLHRDRGAEPEAKGYTVKHTHLAPTDCPGRAR